MQPHANFRCPFAPQPDQLTALDTAAASNEIAAIKAILQRRKLRNKVFADAGFADPAWDMLLDLYCSALEHRRVSVSSVCIASGVPVTTAMRWLTRMEKQGLVDRRRDNRDGRRVFVELTPAALQSMSVWVTSAFNLISSQTTST